MSNKKSVEKLNFEEALAELEELVQKIDAGDQNLDQSVESFERGMQLKKHCEKMLGQAKMKVEKIMSTAENKDNTNAGHVLVEDANIQ